MQNVIIIHGAYGNPEENWFPWLREELEDLRCRVLVPKFPTPEGQNLDNWLAVFEEYKKYIDEDTIVIGHSLGPAFILSVLEDVKVPIKLAVMVAGFVGVLGNPDFDEINGTFTEKDFNWDVIRTNCRDFLVYASDNDPYVPLEKGEYLAERLGGELQITPEAGHFNEAAGYMGFEELLEKIRFYIL